MRSLLVLLALLVASPAYAQRVFRASIKIDDVQNERLDEVEAKVDNLTTSVAALTQAVTTLVEVQKTKSQSVVAAPQAQVASVKAEPKPLRKATTTVTVTPPFQERSVSASNRLQIAAWQAYPDGVYRVRYADVSPRSQVWNHLIQHGFSQAEVQGLSQFEALAIHDLAHGGKVHPGQASVQVAVNSPAPIRQQATANYNVGCANGQCARQGSTSYSRPRLFGLFR